MSASGAVSSARDSRSIRTSTASQRGAAAILGTLDEAAKQLRAYEQAGVERVMLQHLDHRDLEMVALIGRELAPAMA